MPLTVEDATSKTPELWLLQALRTWRSPQQFDGNGGASSQLGIIRSSYSRAGAWMRRRGHAFSGVRCRMFLRWNRTGLEQLQIDRKDARVEAVEMYLPALPASGISMVIRFVPAC